MATQQREDSLPFDESRQAALLGHLLSDDNFFRRTKDRIQPEWFSGTNGVSRGKIWRAKVDFANKNKTAPTEQELLATDTFVLAPDNGQKLKIIYNEAIEQTKYYRLQSLVPKLTEWWHTYIYTTAWNRSVEAWNGSQRAESYKVMEEAIKKIRSNSFEDSGVYSFADMRAKLNKRKAQSMDALTFGVEVFDQILLPIAKGKGSLLPGDTTILLAPSNVGKSTTLINITCANIRRGKHILFLIHEGVDDDIAEKCMMNLIGCNRDELYNEYCTATEKTCAEKFLRFNLAQEQLNRYLRFIPLCKAGLTVEEVSAVVRQEQEAFMADHGGKGYDMLVDDYPAKLTSEVAPHGVFQKRNLDEYVYNYFVQLALEYKFHALLAIQGNRTSAKINRGEKGQDSRLLTMEDVNESYGTMQIATNVVTINRDPWQEANNFTTFYISKSRSSEKGQAVVVKGRWEHSVTHSDELKAISYKGGRSMSLQIDQLFTNYAHGSNPHLDYGVVAEAMKKVQN